MSASLVNPLPRLIPFQYNPDEVTRTLKPRTPPSGGGASSDAHRVWGAPSESIAMTVEFDATNALAVGDADAAITTVAGAIASLELLLYPATTVVMANAALLLTGTIEVLPPEGPLTVLVWGTGAVPVKLTGLTIREQAFDPQLNPIRASVDVSLEVLSYDDLGPADPGFALFLAHQMSMEMRSVEATFSGGGLV